MTVIEIVALSVFVPLYLMFSAGFARGTELLMKTAGTWPTASRAGERLSKLVIALSWPGAVAYQLGLKLSSF